MQMRRDILIWLAIWSREIWNIKMQGISSEQEALKTALIERTNQTAAAIWTAARPLFVRIAAVNVWAATLSVAADGWQV